MKKPLLSFLVFLLFVSLNAVAGKTFTVESGSLSALKGQKINVMFTYNNMLVGKMNEDEYLKTRAADRNEKEKGSGEKWIEAWKKDRTTKFEPVFIEFFNKYSKKNYSTTMGKSSSSKYTMTVNTDVTEPGFVVGFTTSPYIKVTITITETATGKTVSKLVSERLYGQKNFDVGSSIQSSYAMASIALAKFMIKANK